MWQVSRCCNFTEYMPLDKWQLVLLREREIQSTEINSGTSRDLNSIPSEYYSQMLLPLCYWAHSKGATQKLHIAALHGGLSQIPTDSPSQFQLILLLALNSNWFSFSLSIPTDSLSLRGKASRNLAEFSTQCCYIQLVSCSSAVGPVA